MKKLFLRDIIRSSSLRSRMFCWCKVKFVVVYGEKRALLHNASKPAWMSQKSETFIPEKKHRRVSNTYWMGLSSCVQLLIRKRHVHVQIIMCFPRPKADHFECAAVISSDEELLPVENIPAAWVRLHKTPEGMPALFFPFFCFCCVFAVTAGLFYRF